MISLSGPSTRSESHAKDCALTSSSFPAVIHRSFHDRQLLLTCCSTWPRRSAEPACPAASFAVTLDELQALVLVAKPTNRAQSARVDEHQVGHEEVSPQIRERLRERPASTRCGQPAPPRIRVDL